MSLTPEENNILDMKVLQKDRRHVSAGYPFKTFDEMSGETAAKNWLIKGVLAKGETSAWIAPPGGMKSALLAQASICVAGGLDWRTPVTQRAVGLRTFQEWWFGRWGPAVYAARSAEWTATKYRRFDLGERIREAARL